MNLNPYIYSQKLMQKAELKTFKKVMPTDYKRVLLEQDRKEKKAG